MLTLYLVIVIVLFILAISDLVVGVSNDAVNFLNSAVGAKAASFKLILGVAAVGIIVGCTFSSGMMEVARKGIFHPEHFYFSEIILLFLAVMVTDILLLDTFNTLGLPTSTTVSIVFELLGAAVAFSLIKIYTSADALGMNDYINSSKALAIISGILLSVVVAFTVGLIAQYLTRMMFSFDYKPKMKYLGSVWGGFAIAAITYFLLVKGAKGSSFMNDEMIEAISNHATSIIMISFVAWTVILQIISTIYKNFDILKFIVLIGTFSLAMAFAGNDLVNFVGVPLAGLNSYELYKASGVAADSFLMADLAGKVRTPTLLLLIAGIIMTITLWTSKKARSVIKTSLDLGRQYEGSERFTSFAVSRSLVRNISSIAHFVSTKTPKSLSSFIDRRFDERPFIARQYGLGKDAPSFDMVRAATTLVVASILIAIGTSFKLPLSTTYVTFMVFMGTSLADGAWGRESAVYRVSGVISVIGGWFFTAFSAFTVAFLMAGIFHFGGTNAIVGVLILTAYIIYHTHKYHDKKLQEEKEIDKAVEEEPLNRETVMTVLVNLLNEFVNQCGKHLDETMDAFAKEDLKKLTKTQKNFKKVFNKSAILRSKANFALTSVEDEELDTAHFYLLAVGYLHEMTKCTSDIIKAYVDHVDNNHSPFMPEQIDDLKFVISELKALLDNVIDVYKSDNPKVDAKLFDKMDTYVDLFRSMRGVHVGRIKDHKIGTRNSLLFMNTLSNLRNLGWYGSRLIRVFLDIGVRNGVSDPGSKPQSIDEGQD